MLFLLAVGLFAPTRQLGHAALFGRAYLWGESSSRIYRGAEVVWFVDGLEVAQHGLFVLTGLSAFTLMGGRLWTRGALALLGLLLALDTLRGVQADGGAWLGVTSPAFWFFFAGWGLLGVLHARVKGG